MTVARGIGLLVFLGTLSVATIGLRGEEARVAMQIERLQRSRTDLRRESWALEMEISRLRAPGQVGDRLQRWSLNLQEPCPPSLRSGDWETVVSR